MRKNESFAACVAEIPESSLQKKSKTFDRHEIQDCLKFKRPGFDL